MRVYLHSTKTYRMNTFINRVNKALKTKEDMQRFVLIVFVLFVLLVKCYMVVTDPHVAKSTSKGTNSAIVKLHP